jgi:superfamily II DNA helicase RecQ
MGIKATIWGKDGCEAGASVVLVTREAMTQDKWRDYANRHQMKGNIDRVVLDEVQEVLTTKDGYRPKLRDVRLEMDRLSARQIFLTGTLPPSLESRFRERLGLTGDHVKILRSPTTRENLRYCHLHATSDDEEDTLARQLQRQVADDGTKAIFYVRSRPRCDVLASTLSAPPYHAGMDEETRTANLCE